MSQDDKKKSAAVAAIEYIEAGMIVGVGTGSTVNHFIDALAGIKGKIDGAVSSSEASTERMKKHGIKVYDLNETGGLSVYVDGADESNKHLHLIKGGGGALLSTLLDCAACVDALPGAGGSCKLRWRGVRTCAAGDRSCINQLRGRWRDLVPAG